MKRREFLLAALASASLNAVPAARAAEDIVTVYKEAS
jgi:hypothetical protein